MEIKRKSNVEGLRAIGTTLVVLSHFMVLFYPASYWDNAVCHTKQKIEILIGSTPLGYWMNGNTGVMIFLVITGAGAYWLSEVEKRKIVDSVINRPFKIFVPMLLSTIIIWYIIKVNGCFLDLVLQKTESIWCSGYINNFGPFINIFKDFFTYCTLYNNPLWTIKYLFVGFYLALFVCLIASDSRKTMFAISAIIILFILKEYYLMSAMAGIIIAEKNKYTRKNINGYTGILVLLVAIYLGGVPTGMASKYWIYSYLPINSVFLNSDGLYVLIYHMISAALLLWLTLNSKILKNILNTKIFQFIGRYSMGLYFTHFAVLMSFTSFMFLNLNIESYNCKAIVTIILSLLNMMVVAIIFDYANNKIVKSITSKIKVKTSNS